MLPERESHQYYFSQARTYDAPGPETLMCHRTVRKWSSGNPGTADIESNARMSLSQRDRQRVVDRSLRRKPTVIKSHKWRREASHSGQITVAREHQAKARYSQSRSWGAAVTSGYILGPSSIVRELVNRRLYYAVWLCPTSGHCGFDFWSCEWAGVVLLDRRLWVYEEREDNRNEDRWKWNWFRDIWAIVEMNL